MLKWLAVGAVAWLVWPAAASAQIRGFEATRRLIASGRERPAEARPSLNLRIAEQPPVVTGRPMASGMLVSRDVAPNAMLGLGLVRLGNKKSGGSIGISGGSRRRKPAVTFVMHF